MKTVRNIQLPNYDLLAIAQKEFVDGFEKCGTGSICAEENKTSVDVLNELALVLGMQPVILDFSIMNPEDFMIHDGIVPVWAAAVKTQPSIVMFSIPTLTADNNLSDALVEAWLHVLSTGKLVGNLRGGGQYDITGKSMFGISCPIKDVKSVVVKPVVTKKAVEPTAPAFVHSNPTFKAFTVASLLFDTETCSRCDGSGQHQYNMRFGRICFRCKGTGKTWINADVDMVHVYNEAVKVCRSVDAMDIKVGDVISINNKWEEVSTIEREGDFLCFVFVNKDFDHVSVNSRVRRLRTEQHVLDNISDKEIKSKIIGRIAQRTSVSILEKAL